MSSASPNINRYSVIPRVLIIATQDDAVLLIRRSLHKKLWPGIYNAPGGHVEAGEDPYEAARRELREETGLEASLLQLRGLLLTPGPQEHTGVLVFVFRARVEGTLRQSAEGEAGWHPLSQLATLPTLPDFVQLLDLTLNHKGALFYAVKDVGSDGSEVLRVRYE